MDRKTELGTPPGCRPMTLTLTLTHLSSQLLEARQLSLQTPVLSRPQHLLPGPPASPGHPPLGYSGTRGSSIQHTQAGGGPLHQGLSPRRGARCRQTMTVEVAGGADPQREDCVTPRTAPKSSAWPWPSSFQKHPPAPRAPLSLEHIPYQASLALLSFPKSLSRSLLGLLPVPSHLCLPVWVP